MGGLLYKDFVSLNKIGKVKLTWLLSIITVVFIVLRIVFRGDGTLGYIEATNDRGNTGNIVDLLFVFYFFNMILMSMMQINGSVSKTINEDEKNKIKNYLFAMPFDKKTYIASKYIFVGILAYVFMTLSFIWGISCTAFCSSDGPFLEFSSFMLNSVSSLVSVAIFIASIEFPLFFLLGKEKGTMLVTAFITIIAFIVLGYLLFGDLSVFRNWDIFAMMEYIKAHGSQIAIIESLLPVINLGLYYLSYRITCHFYERKEA